MGKTTIPGFPDDLASLDLDEARAQLDLDGALYPIEAVYGAAYVFIDRCYVFLDRPEPTKLRVVLSPKKLGDGAEAELRDVVGQFANELLSAAWRHQITLENRAQIEAVTLRAIGGAMGPPTLDELEGFDFTEDAFEDPLGIALSWEEKYQAKAEAKLPQLGEAERMGRGTPGDSLPRGEGAPSPLREREEKGETEDEEERA